MKYDIAFLTNMFPQQTAEEYARLGFGQGGANITYIQTALIHGLEQASGTCCHIINKALIRGKGGPVPTLYWNHALQQSRQDVSFGYLNKPVFSSNLLFHYSKKHLKRWLGQIDGQGILIAYGATNHNYQALTYAKKRRPDIVTGLIVPDLPENTKAYGKSRLMDLKNRITNYLTRRSFRRSAACIDVFFPFSAHMCDALQCWDRYRVLEGIATDTFAGITPRRDFDESKRIVLYGGGLNKAYGLDILLDAFGQIADPDYRLVLCGNGDYVPTIKQAMERDGRICYLGTIPREELLALQLGADVLVNPRNNQQIFSNYSFPSKNMEYLSSGVPFVGFKLGGIPDEYDPYITYPREETPQALADALLWVCREGREQALARAAQAREFVLSHKNKYAQAQRILDKMAALCGKECE